MNLNGIRWAKAVQSRYATANQRRYENPELRDERYTPPRLVEWCARKAGVEAFDLDVAACEQSHWAPRWYSKAKSGLTHPWDAERVWCNPPFTKPGAWVQEAWEEAFAQDFRVLAMLLPAMRQEQPWWQTFVEPYRDRPTLRFGYTLESHHPLGRWAFNSPEGPLESAGFPLVLLVWRLTRPWKP